MTAPAGAKQADAQRPAARGGVAILCFLLILAGQGYLLRRLIAGDAGSILRLPFLVECCFAVILLGACVLCAVKPTGWTSKTGCIAAFAVYTLYVVHSLVFYNDFSAAYLTGIQAQYDSAGGALVALKLVVALIGVTAGIPASPPIDKFEYSRRLREKAQLQQAQWARNSAEGAKKDLDSAIAKLKDSLSEEELAELLSRLQKEAAEKVSAAKEPAGSDGSCPCTQQEPEWVEASPGHFVACHRCSALPAAQKNAG